MNMRSVRYPCNAPIDREELLNRCMGRPDLMDRILSSFQARVDDDIECLIDCIQQGDAEAVAALAHKLKGASLTVSALPLAQVAGQLHALACDSAGPEMNNYAPKLLDEYNRILELLNAGAEGAS